MNIKLLEKIQKTAFQFFQDFSNWDESSKGYGLSVDHTNNMKFSSIATTGFMLSSLIIGVTHDYIKREKALQQARKTLSTLYHHASQQFGFFAHYLEMKTGKRRDQCEYSTIDTALVLCGVISVDSFFHDEEISRLSKLILDRVDWSKFIYEKEGKKLLHMSYNPDKDGAYTLGNPGFIHQWDMFAEQLMMYVIIGGSAFSEQAYDLYHGFTRNKGTYGAYEYIYSPGNTLFVYQFPLAWLDLKDYVDDQQISWFENARFATLAHLSCSIDHHESYHTLTKNFFGFTASDTPKGYRVFSALPNDHKELITDGTVAPFAAIGSLPFTPSESMSSINAMLNIENLWGKYGFYDAFNLESKIPWISNRYIGVDKGLEMLMVNAYLSKDVQIAFMNHSLIKKGFEVLHWEKRNKN
ncbi:MAG: glucoamylase family protein [Bacillota bacterium]